jgi:hypothetical protein
MQLPERTIADRLARQLRDSRSRTYWLAVLVMAALGVAFVMLYPVRRPRPALIRPSAPRPDFRVTRVTEMSTSRVERLSLVVLVRPGMPDETLEAVLSWALFSIVDKYNRQRERRVRIVWAYAVADSAAPLSHWRAMAIWADPELPESLQPAHSGGDAVRIGSVEFDFTNPLLSNQSVRRQS